MRISPGLLRERAGSGGAGTASVASMPSPATAARMSVGERYRDYCGPIGELHRHFDRRGTTIHAGRNLIKAMTIDGPGGGSIRVAVKAFKTPVWPRGLVYAHLRRSKAQRSMIHARKLREMGIDTPDPVACIEYDVCGCLRHSYYVCRYWRHNHDLTGLLYNEIPSGVEPDVLLKQLVKFTYQQHQMGVFHLDYNPGNILVRYRGRDFEFALVDLNRLRFGTPDLESRIAGLVRLTDVADYLGIIGRQYAKLHGADPEDFCRRLEAARLGFARRRRRMRRVKALFR